VYVSARQRVGERPAVFALGADDNAPVVLTSDPGDRLGAVDVTPDGRWLLGPVLSPDGGLRLAWGPADGRPGAASSLQLAGATVGGGPPDGAPAEVRLQP
jgi:hypothetical protein